MSSKGLQALVDGVVCCLCVLPVGLQGEHGGELRLVGLRVVVLGRAPDEGDRLQAA